MTLSALMEDKFRADVRHVGEAYVTAGRVSITRVLPNQVLCVVRDGSEYETRLVRDDGNLKMFCQCERFQKTGVCKHLWATIVAVDGAGYLTASAKPGYVPPFASETTTSWSIDDWEEEDDFEPPTNLAKRTATKSPAAKAASKIAVELRPWESKLLELRGRLDDGGTAAPANKRDQRIVYEIDAKASRSVGQLVVQTSQRQRRANGQWGKLKPLKLRADRLDEVEQEDDRRILAYLTGGTAERSNWTAQQTETQTLAHRYHVAYELCELIVPLMCETERVRLLDASEKDEEPLSWDDGPPWELCVHVVRKEDGELRVGGELARDGEKPLKIDEADLVVPGGVVVARGRIARLADFDAFDWISLLRDEGTIEVPEGDAVDLVDRLFDMPRLPRLELPSDLELEKVTERPLKRVVVRTPKNVRWQIDRLQADVEFEYFGAPVRGSSTQWAIVQREEQRCIVRDREAESDAWETLRSLGFRRRMDRDRGGHDVEIPSRELGGAVRSLMSAGWDVLADGSPVRQAGDLQFRVKSDIDWFELEGDVDFGGLNVAFPELLAALGRGDTTIRLDDGSLGILPEEWLTRFGLFAGLGTQQEESLRFEANQIALLDALLESQPAVDYDERFLELRERLHQFEGVEEVDEPKGFKGELRHYQRQGLGWLQFLEEFRLGGCLADDMGLGKTIQVLALLRGRLKKGKNRLPSLVVVPKSLMFNWKQECERFTPELKVLEYAGLDRSRLRDEIPSCDLVLTTYGTLRRDAAVLRDVQFDYLVLDEAQTIKNAGSQVAKAARLLRSHHRVALSGTPIENNLGDLWSIFEFLNPGMLGRSTAFKLTVADQSDESSRRLLAQGLRPFILRRTKQEVASELPDKSEQTIYCEMGEEQAAKYEELRDHYRASLLGMIDDKGLAKSKMHVLEALLRLRQAACHPGLLDDGNADAPSAKLDVMIPQIEELLAENHKALVFSQFTSMLSLVRNRLDEKGIVYEYLDGQTRDRQARVERFQNDPDCGLFLISLKAGGLGLNLTAADYVFLLDPWWNPAVEAQAIDRAHRVGQTRHVFAYRLIVKGTVEEKITELQQQKRDLAEAILESNGSLLKEMTTEDLQRLLS